MTGANPVTATNLAAAIDNLEEFSASAVGSVVTVEGPPGPDGGTILFRAIHKGIVENFILSPSDGLFAPGSPVIGAPQIG